MDENAWHFFYMNEVGWHGWKWMTRWNRWKLLKMNENKWCWMKMMMVDENGWLWMKINKWMKMDEGETAVLKSRKFE